VNPRLKHKICIICSIEFLGGSLAKYCPSCRAERIRERDRERHQRKLAGQIRHIGSIDLCQVCGSEYIVNAGPQKYCEPCIAEKRRQWSQESFKRQYYGNPVKRQQMIERAQQWAKDHPDRTKSISIKSYLKTIAERTDKRRKMYGFKLRPLGRTESCPRCSNDFIVQQRNQKYCDRCR